MSSTHKSGSLPSESEGGSENLPARFQALRVRPVTTEAEDCVNNSAEPKAVSQARDAHRSKASIDLTTESPTGTPKISTYTRELQPAEDLDSHTPVASSPVTDGMAGKPPLGSVKPQAGQYSLSTPPIGSPVQVDLSPLLDKPVLGKTPLSSEAPPDTLTLELDADGMPLTAGHVVAAVAAHATPLSPDESPEMLQQRTWDWLSEQPEDAAELAALLSEAAPKLRLSRDESGSGSRTGSGRLQFKMSHSRDAVRSVRARLAAAMPMPVGAGEIDWKALTLVAGSEAITFEEPPPLAASPLGKGFASPATGGGGDLIEINSGGQVLFCFFAPSACSPESSPASTTASSPFSNPDASRHVQPDAAQGSHHGSARRHSRTASSPKTPGSQTSPKARELCAVVKFHGSRLTTQSEQFANELTRHLRLHAPACRILRKAERQYSRGANGTRQLHAGHGICAWPITVEAGRTFAPRRVVQTASELGRLFSLDMLLGNADRLPCEALAWRGNPGNTMFARAGPHAHRTVAIDSLVQRRPPGGRVSVEDAACHKLTELMLNIEEVAGQTLCEALASSPMAAAAMDSPEAAQAFQQALRTTLQDAVPLKGLLEMISERTSEWIHAFIADMEEAEEAEESPISHPAGHNSPRRANETAHNAQPEKPWQSPSRKHSSPGNSSPRGVMSSPPQSRSGPGTASPQAGFDTTQRIRSITREAKDNKRLQERLTFWKETMRTRGVELRSAFEDWQDRRFSGDDSPSRLTTGFLDGNNPIVDIYELKVRLEHMLQRMRVLQSAAATASPTQLLPHLFVSGAVPASAHHVLHHLGITHILNATDDLPEPPATAGFIFERVPLKDAEDEPIAERFQHAQDYIEDAKASGGRVLLHCHEGVSRSITLALAYLMRTQDWTMKEALDFVQQKRPAASPNAGFAAALSDLEQDLYGKRTVKVKSGKPEPRSCPQCNQVVGLSTASLQLHLKRCNLGS